jgi:putative transposase
LKGKRYTTEDKIRNVLEADGSSSISDVCRERHISEVSFHGWKRQFGLTDLSEARRLKELECENAELKKMLASVISSPGIPEPRHGGIRSFNEPLSAAGRRGARPVGRCDRLPTRNFLRDRAGRPRSRLATVPLAGGLRLLVQVEARMAAGSMELFSKIVVGSAAQASKSNHSARLPAGESFMMRA